MTDLLVAVRREMLDPVHGVTSLVGSSDLWDAWIWRSKLWEQIEGTGKAAIVLNRRSSWLPPSEFHTNHRPRLQVEIFADPARTLAGQPVAQNAEDRAYEVYEAVDRLLHRPQGGDIVFDTMRVHASVRLSEPDVSDVPNTEDVVRLLVDYGVSID